MPDFFNKLDFASGVRVLHSDTVAVGTDADTNEKDLMTYTLPADTLNVDGVGVRVSLWGTFNSSADTKIPRVYFGSDSESLGTYSTQSVFFTVVTVLRSGVGSQLYQYRTRYDNIVPVIRSRTLSEDETAGIVIKLTGQNGAAVANDMVCRAFFVEYLGAL